MASANKKLFRILMLHGYRQNEKYFYDKTGSVRKMLKKYADLVYCQAPHYIPPLDEGNTTENNQDYGWWLKSKEWPNENFEANFEKTLSYINQVFVEKGPFDGVFGFSMGGILSSILCRLIERKQNQGKYGAIKFNFTIICAANAIAEEKLLDYFDTEQPIPIDSLHLIGKSDKLVSYESALELTKNFVQPKVFEHDGGHLIPRDSDAKKAFTEFFEEMIRKYNND